MGSPTVVRLFAETYKRPLAAWQMKQRSWDPDAAACMARSAACQGATDLSLTVYADDTNKLLATSLRDGAAEVLAAKVRKSNDVLDEELRKAGYVQNRQKQVVNVGMAKQAEAKKVYYVYVPFEGSVQITSRILGSMANSFFQLGPERAARIAATRLAFRRMGGFWYQKGVPWATRRLVFITRVQGTALSGLTAFPVGEADCNALDKVLLALARSAMRGKALKRTKAGVRSIPASEVWRYWRLAPTWVELRIRRLAWYKKMAAQPEQHVQEIIALTGKANFEEVGQLDAEGRPSEKASPWCRQMARDLQELEVLEAAEPLVKALEGRILPIFVDEEWKQDFLAIDLKEMRAQLWQSKVPPPGSAARKDWERMEAAESQPEGEKRNALCA